MILEVVGGALLSASLKLLFEKFASLNLVDFKRHKKLFKLLKKLNILLLSVNAALDDAEERQLRDPLVREWMDELKEVTYDAEQVIEEMNTHALEGESERSARDRASKPIFSFSTVFDKATQSKILNILDRLEFILNQKNVLGLKEGGQKQLLPKSAPGLLREESSIHSRDGDKDIIKKFLSADDVSSVCVFPILGMAGIGKTTLAQFAYNDQRVKFTSKAWVHVSDEFDVLRITKALFKAVTSQRSDTEDLFLLQVQLKKALEDKKFLFVLDDVWNENYNLWDLLRSPFECNSHGSKIIVTTRSAKVASLMGNVSTHQLQPLSQNDSWLLFAKHAFNNGESCAHPNLESIGRAIVEKCKGLPLAVKSIGGLLRSEVNADKWESMRSSDIWMWSEKEQNILPALWLTYYHLPPHLKRCFAYCAIFPKGYEFEKEQLILLWMAEDLLPHQKGMRLEDVGEECFNDLISRSLFQQSVRGGNLIITMHELLSDLATFVSGEFSRTLDGNGSYVPLNRTRHLSFRNRETFPQDFFSQRNDLRTYLHLSPTRSLLAENLELPEIPTKQCLRVISLPHGSFKKPSSIGNLKHLRYLDLSLSNLKDLCEEVGKLYNLQTLLLSKCSALISLPTSISKLKNLRHLDLSFSGIKEIPNNICNLSNLQKLVLSYCEELTSLPDNLGKLIKLRHLDIRGTTSLRKMPSGIRHMEDLRTLSKLVLGNNGSTIDELGDLQHLQGHLEISGLEHLSNVLAFSRRENRGTPFDVEQLSMARLNDKKHLSELTFLWIDNEHRSEDSTNEDRDLLHHLRPSNSLKEITITSYGGDTFPNWLADRSFSILVSLRLVNCKKCSVLPPLGQLPSLTELSIVRFEKVTMIGPEFYHAHQSTTDHSETFRSLEILFFQDMSEWKTWSLYGNKESDEVFPRLKKLCLLQCPAMKKLPITKRETIEIQVES